MWSGGGDTLCHNHPVWPDGWLARRCFVPENKLLTTLLIFWSTPSGIYKKVIQTLSVPFLTFLMWPWLLKIPSEDFADVTLWIGDNYGDDWWCQRRWSTWRLTRWPTRWPTWRFSKWPTWWWRYIIWVRRFVQSPNWSNLFLDGGFPSTLAHTYYETSFTE